MKKKRHTIHRYGTLNPARLGLCLKTEQQKEQIERSIFTKLIQKQFPHHYKSIIKMSGKTGKGGVCIAGAYRLNFVHIGKEAWNYGKDE